MARLDTLARRAIETINLLKRDKLELTVRVAQLDELLEQERSNTRQRDKLFQSNKSEVDQFTSEIAELKVERTEYAALITEQTDTIARLEEELTGIAGKLSEKEERAISNETLSVEQSKLIAKLNEVVQEREELRAKAEHLERETAGWAVTLNKEEAKKAEKALDVIIKRIDQVEKRVGQAQKNGSTAPELQPEIFNPSTA
jgi:chromosome segregation ATPase